MTTRQYRVETQQTARHPLGATDWWPEGDHNSHRTQEDAQKYLDQRGAWYGNTLNFEHRIVTREVTDWMPVTT